MRQYLKLLKESRELEIIDELLTLREAVSLIKKTDEKNALLIEKIEDYDFRLISNILTKRKHLRLALNVENDAEAYKKLIEASENPQPLKLVEKPRMITLQRKLAALPALKFYSKDGGPYITTGIFIAKDPDTNVQNASIHRLMVVNGSVAAVRIVPRHLYAILKKYEERGEDAPIAVVIGANPVYYIAAAHSPPYGVDELQVANAIKSGKLSAYKDPDTGLVIPADAEVVIKGKITLKELLDEGPFVDITGTYDVVRKQPKLIVEKVEAKPDAIFYQILPAGAEHRLLMGFPREAAIWRGVSQVVPRVHGVRLTKGGCGWLHAVISITKQREGDAKNAILAALAAHSSLKLAIVVDEDINIDNLHEIEWALATRMQPDRDIIIIPGARGSSLDPSADQKNLITAKWGIDATIPLGKERSHFIRA